ncbi:hypothetical protein COCNU_scaffold002442G000030 [Cocos nucifera]|nr:hypothetical protein [Cocos nucifera]
MLSKELQTHKRKGTMSNEPTAKKARVNTPSSIAPDDAAIATKVTTIAEVALTARVSAVVKSSMPPSSTSPPAKDLAPRPPARREEWEKKKEKKIVVKVHRKTRPDGSSDDGDNPR